MEKKFLLVTGATGNQGRALIQALIADGRDMFHILALTRDKMSTPAQKLAELSDTITLFQGTLDNTEAVFEIAKAATDKQPIWGVFSMQQSGNSKSAALVEEKQGKALVDAALAAGVEHFVYTSVDRNGDNPTDVPYFASKHRLEHYLIDKAKGTKMSWTILRPVSFMQNFEGSTAKVYAEMLRLTLKSKPIQLVDTRDVGIFAAKAFMDPGAHRGQILSLAGDELAFDQLNSLYVEKTGSKIPTVPSPAARLVLLLSKDLRVMFTFFAVKGYGADMEQMRALQPGLRSFGSWLESKQKS